MTDTDVLPIQKEDAPGPKTIRRRADFALTIYRPPSDVVWGQTVQDWLGYPSWVRLRFGDGGRFLGVGAVEGPGERQEHYAVQQISGTRTFRIYARHILKERGLEPTEAFTREAIPDEAERTVWIDLAGLAEAAPTAE